jgi:hypothetical protein
MMPGPAFIAAFQVKEISAPLFETYSNKLGANLSLLKKFRAINLMSA